jgi:hypothetical protein
MVLMWNKATLLYELCPLFRCTCYLPHTAHDFGNFKYIYRDVTVYYKLSVACIPPSVHSFLCCALYCSARSEKPPLIIFGLCEVGIIWCCFCFVETCCDRAWLSDNLWVQSKTFVYIMHCMMCSVLAGFTMSTTYFVCLTQNHNRVCLWMYLIFWNLIRTQFLATS